MKRIPLTKCIGICRQHWTGEKLLHRFLPNLEHISQNQQGKNIDAQEGFLKIDPLFGQ